MSDGILNLDPGAPPPGGNPPPDGNPSPVGNPPPLGTGNPPPEGKPPGEAPPAGDWRATLPDDIKNDPSLAAIKDIPSLAKSLIHAQKLVGKEKLVLPDKHGTEEDWKAVFHKLGNPEKIEDYQLKLPEGEHLNKDFIEDFRKMAHENGILPRQAQKFLDWYADSSKKVIEGFATQETQRKTEAEASLKKEWGEAYDSQVYAANLALRDFADQDLMAELKSSGMGNSPQLIKFLAKVGAELREDEVRGIATRNGTQVLAPAEAKQKANEIMANPKHAYNDASHPNHAAAVKEVSDLFEMAHPAQKK